jgi:gas vesicle structural protein
MATSTPVRPGPSPSGLYDVLDLILDKGLVIDAYVRVSLVGIEILTIDLRVVVASVDTYLRFAEAANRLDLRAVDESQDLQDLTVGIGKGASASAAKSAVSSGAQSAKDSAKEALGLEDEEEEEEEEQSEES